MATKIKFNFKKAKFKIAWLKALKVIFGLELQTAKIAVDSGEFYYTLKDNETYEAICIKVAEVCGTIVAEVCGTIGESFFSEEEIKNVMSVVEPQIESQSTKNINTTNNSRNIQEITPNVVKVGSVYILTEEEYNHLYKCRGLLMDMLGTYKQFLQAYESFK